MPAEMPETGGRDAEAESTLCRVDVPRSQPDADQIPEFAQRRDQRVIDRGVVVPVVLRPRLVPEHLYRQRVHVQGQAVGHLPLVLHPQPSRRTFHQPIPQHIQVLGTRQRVHQTR